MNRRKSRKSPRNSEPRRSKNVTPGRWVVGWHAVSEALRVRSQAVAELLVLEGSAGAKLLEEASAPSIRGVGVRWVADAQLNSLSSNHQGIAARVLETPDLDWERLSGPTQLMLLDGIVDPHNLGAVLRSAWMFGVSGLLIPDSRSVGLTPTVCKVACGGAEHVPIQRITAIASVLKQLKDEGYWVIGLEAHGPEALWGFQCPERVIWALGSEHDGLKKATSRECDSIVAIPQKNSRASLNASVAAASAFAEFARFYWKT